MEKVTMLKTEILPVSISSFELVKGKKDFDGICDDWSLILKDDSPDAAHLRRAARELQTSDIPVAFPTETVYGLGADATRSLAVQGIYKAKQRPSDNPLIVHIHSLQQLRTILSPPPAPQRTKDQHNEGRTSTHSVEDVSKSDKDVQDPIPSIYLSLIKKFWPGPLTLIMPNPEESVLAPEVTAGLPTFGVRMPSSLHALALLKLCNLPLAAPSANASTKPSPTDAEHVKHDLDGRISTIIDGGPCQVGVESTVVDGLSNPPAILRPGGISIEEIRLCTGWENVTVGYKDISESGTRPRAPGMKYKHYSPKAPVILYEHGRDGPTEQDISKYFGQKKSIGVIRTVAWPQACGLPIIPQSNGNSAAQEKTVLLNGDASSTSLAVDSAQVAKGHKFQVKIDSNSDTFDLWEINLESNPDKIARGLFAALRELDKLDVDAIFVEGVDDSRGDVSAAVMNRLRKAAEIKI